METQTNTTTHWGVDPMHSEVQFKVKHLVISTVTGSFKKFEGKISSDGEHFDGARAGFRVEVNSIDTNVADRDNHLKSDDFFAAEQYPHIIFENGIFHKTGNNSFSLQGDLTIRDTTKPIEMKAELGGIMQDPYGNTKAGFEIEGKVSRKEYGLKWNQLTEAGGVVVGDEVKLILNIQLAKKN